METKTFYGKRCGASAASACKVRRPVLQENTAHAKRSSKTIRTVKKKAAVGLCSRPLARVPTCRSCTCVDTFLQQREQYDSLLGRIWRLETVRRLQCLAEGVSPHSPLPPTPRAHTGSGHSNPGSMLTTAQDLADAVPAVYLNQEAPFTQQNSQMPVQRTVLRDIQLLPISQEKEGELYLQSIGIDGKARVDRYAALVFLNLVTFEIYWGWTTSVNFDGSRSKSTLPCNLREPISSVVNRRFSTLTLCNWKS